jgi:tetratricopeptide (TPR) repeat protein
LLESLAAADRSDVSRKLYLALALTEVGEAYSRTGQPSPAREALRRATAIASALARADPDSVEPTIYLAFAESVEGGVLARDGDPEGAMRSYDASIATYRTLIEGNGANLQLRLEIAAGCLGAARTLAGDCPRAVPYLQCGAESFAEMGRHFRLTRKQSREQAEIATALRACGAGPS